MSSSDCYLVPWADGTVLIGATRRCGLTAEHRGGRAHAAGAAQNLLPAMEDATFLEARVACGPRCRWTAHHRAVDSASVSHATGHYRNGILFAPLTQARS